MKAVAENTFRVGVQVFLSRDIYYRSTLIIKKFALHFKKNVSRTPIPPFPRKYATDICTSCLQHSYVSRHKVISVSCVIELFYRASGKKDVVQW